MAALCERVFPAAEFKDTKGAVEILNAPSTHGVEADAVISEITV